MSMTVAEVELVAVTAAKTAVGETLRLLGVDVDNPLAVQADMAHLRFWRTTFNSALGKIIMAGIIGVVLLGALLLATRFH